MHKCNYIHFNMYIKSFINIVMIKTMKHLSSKKHLWFQYTTLLLITFLQDSCVSNRRHIQPPWLFIYHIILHSSPCN